MRRLLRFAVASALISAVHASAESRVCIGGDLDHLTASDKRGCLMTADQVRRGAAKFGAPDDWHYFVVCTASDWKLYASFSKHSADELATMGADTDISNRTTFIRGEWLHSTDTPGSDRLIAREVAIAITQSSDENVIEAKLDQWIPRVYKNVPELAATPAPAIEAKNDPAGVTAGAPVLEAAVTVPVLFEPSRQPLFRQPGIVSPFFERNTGILLP